jgi:hypothetical protein
VFFVTYNNHTRNKYPKCLVSPSITGFKFKMLGLCIGVLILGNSISKHKVLIFVIEFCRICQKSEKSQQELDFFNISTNYQQALNFSQSIN